jgi:hypothetical protein
MCSKWFRIAVQRRQMYFLFHLIKDEESSTSMFLIWSIILPRFHSCSVMRRDSCRTLLICLLKPTDMSSKSYLPLLDRTKWSRKECHDTFSLRESVTR